MYPNTCHISSTQKLPVPMISPFFGIPYHCLATPLVSTVCAPQSINSFLPSLSLSKSGCKPLPRSLPWKFSSTSRTRYFPRACFHDSHLGQAWCSSPWLSVTKVPVSNTQSTHNPYLCAKMNLRYIIPVRVFQDPAGYLIISSYINPNTFTSFVHVI